MVSGFEQVLGQSAAAFITTFSAFSDPENHDSVMPVWLLLCQRLGRQGEGVTPAWLWRRYIDRPLPG